MFESPLWQQFEERLWEKPSSKRKDSNTHIETYVALMLMTKTKEHLLLNRNAIFKAYKDFAVSENRGVDVEIETISEYVNVYKYLVGESQKNPIEENVDFGYFMRSVCKKTDFYPVIFAIACCGAESAEKQRMFSLLESYVIRRHVCKLPDGDYNKFAPQICKEIGNYPSYKTLHDLLKKSADSKTRTFPRNDVVERACLSNDFFSSNLKQYIFGRIVKYTTTSRDEKRDLKGLTTDHIMPQAWRDKSGWRKLAEEYKNDERGETEIDRTINTIGNLTPMSKGLNSAKSNRDWVGSKGAREHLGECDLKLTRMLAENELWGLKEINARSKELAGYICEIWQYDIPE